MSTEYDGMRPDVDAVALASYTAGVLRARAEYADHPLASTCTPTHECAWNRRKRHEENARRRARRKK